MTVTPRRKSQSVNGAQDHVLKLRLGWLGAKIKNERSGFGLSKVDLRNVVVVSSFRPLYMRSMRQSKSSIFYMEAGRADGNNSPRIQQFTRVFQQKLSGAPSCDRVLARLLPRAIQ